MTDGQSANLSWNKAPIWRLRPDFSYCQTAAGLLMWRALSLTRGRVCRLQLLLALASAVILRSESCGTRDHILLCQIRDFPFHHSLRLVGLCGGIRPCLHTSRLANCSTCYLRPEIHLHNILRCIPYPMENTMRLLYKAPSVNVVFKHMKICCVGGMYTCATQSTSII
jgi:hypothetical protein